MNLGFVLAVAGIAIVIAGVIYFFVLPNEEQDFEPQQPVTPPDNGEPVEEGPGDTVEDRPVNPAEPVEEEDFEDVIPDVPEEPRLVDQLDVSDRVVTALKDSNIRVVAELENLDGDFEDIDGIGPTYAEEIRQALREE